MPLNQAIALIAFVGLCLGIGGVGGLLTARSVREWFPTLEKPRWNPPSWLFAPVWTMLYIAMGLAAWMIWREDKLYSAAGYWFAAQLVLNLGWSWLFFYLRRPDLAFAEIVVLWITIFATLLLFWQINTVAGILFVPYLAWVTFATALNRAIWRLNRQKK